MIDLPYYKAIYNEKTETFNVSFRMTKELFDSINTIDCVEDVGLCILVGIEREVKRLTGELDSPDKEQVNITENIDE